MKYNVFVDGSAGTTGLRIFERLKSRNDINLITISDELRKDTNERLKLINSSDISFLCLPDDAAREIAALADKNVKILDTSTAHRVNSEWVYGMPELSENQKNRIISSNRVAVPGCYATGFISIAYPLINLNIADSDYPFTCHAVSGYSGGGKKMIAKYEESVRPMEYKSPRQYGMKLNHKHLPEMQQIPGLSKKPVFSPIVADYYSGMVATVPIYLDLLPVKITAEEICNKLKAFYKNAKMISVHDFNEMPDDNYMAANTLSGKDNLEIFVYGDCEQAIIISRFDNLGKGSSGAAIQCMNLMLGLDETIGLNGGK